MEAGDSRKRAALAADDVASRKRPRGQDDYSSSSVNQTETGEYRPSSSSLSVETHLAVPLDFIFREVPSSSTLSLSATPTKQRRKTLLTRSEARCLLCINRLAHEVDVLVKIASEAVERRQQSRSFAQKIETKANHRIIRPVLPLLAVHRECLVESILNHVQVELKTRILHELSNCAKALRQFSEQNLTLSESLLDAFGVVDNNGVAAPSSGQQLAKEKRASGDIQEELYTRIERFLRIVKESGLRGEESGAPFEHDTERKSDLPYATVAPKVNVVEVVKQAVSGESQTSMPEFCNGLLDHCNTESPIIPLDDAAGDDPMEDSKVSSPALSAHQDYMRDRTSQVSPGSVNSLEGGNSDDHGTREEHEQTSYNAVIEGEPMEETSPNKSPERNSGNHEDAEDAMSHPHLRREISSPTANTQSAAEALAVLAYDGSTGTHS